MNKWPINPISNPYPVYVHTLKPWQYLQEMKTVWSFKTSVKIYHISAHYIPKDSYLLTFDHF
jgi:hypothetical protein